MNKGKEARAKGKRKRTRRSLTKSKGLGPKANSRKGPKANSKSERRKGTNRNELESKIKAKAEKRNLIVESMTELDPMTKGLEKRLNTLMFTYGQGPDREGTEYPKEIPGERGDLEHLNTTNDRIEYMGEVSSIGQKTLLKKGSRQNEPNWTFFGNRQISNEGKGPWTRRRAI